MADNKIKNHNGIQKGKNTESKLKMSAVGKNMFRALTFKNSDWTAFISSDNKFH